MKTTASPRPTSHPGRHLKGRGPTRPGRASSDQAKGRQGERGQSVLELSLIMPVVMLLLLGIGDLARVYVTLITVQAAAQEAADFGAFHSSNWEGDPNDPSSNHAKTLKAMTERVCRASGHLTDFASSAASCTNPSTSISLIEGDGAPAVDCSQPERSAGPCRVRVDVDYTFRLAIPFALEVGGARWGLPETISFQRTSIFAVSDFTMDRS